MKRLMRYTTALVLMTVTWGCSSSEVGGYVTEHGRDVMADVGASDAVLDSLGGKDGGGSEVGPQLPDALIELGEEPRVIPCETGDIVDVELGAPVTLTMPYPWRIWWESGPYNLAVLPDNRIVTMARDETELYKYRVMIATFDATGNLIGQVLLDEYDIGGTGVIVLPDGRTVISQDGRLVVLNLTGEISEEHQLGVHPYTRLRFDGERVVALDNSNESTREVFFVELGSSLIKNVSVDFTGIKYPPLSATVANGLVVYSGHDFTPEGQSSTCFIIALNSSGLIADHRWTPDTTADEWPFPSSLGFEAYIWDDGYLVDGWEPWELLKLDADRHLMWTASGGPGMLLSRYGNRLLDQVGSNLRILDWGTGEILRSIPFTSPHATDDVYIRPAFWQVGLNGGDGVAFITSSLILVANEPVVDWALQRGSIKRCDAGSE